MKYSECLAPRIDIKQTSVTVKATNMKYSECSAPRIDTTETRVTVKSINVKGI